MRDKAREVAMLILNSYDQPIIVERMTVSNLSTRKNRAQLEAWIDCEYVY